MNTDKFLFYILMAVIPLYWAGGYLYVQGSLIHQVIVLSWYSICLYYLIVFVTKSNSEIGKNIFLFLLLNSFYWFVSAKSRQTDFGVVATLSSLKFILMAFLSYYPFYVLARRDVTTNKKLTVLFLALFISFIFLYNYISISILEEQGADATTNNISYYFVLLFPLSFAFFEKKLLVIAVYVATLFLVIFGAKRGAIVCYSAVSIVFFFYFRKSLPPRYKKSLIFLLIIAFVFIFKYIYNEVADNYFLMRRWEQTMEGNSSSRDIIYSTIWKYTLDSDIFSKLFGHGFMISSEIPGNVTKSFAHQDWLELFVGMGLLGIVIYSSLIISICRFYFRNRQLLNDSEKFAYLSIIAIWLIKPLFSMLYYDPSTFALVTTLGVLHGRIYNKRQIKKRNDYVIV